MRSPDGRNPSTFAISVEIDGKLNERYWLWAGVRPFPVAAWRSENLPEDVPEMMGFASEHPRFRQYTRQAIVPFENRWSLSTIWGDNTYSSNRMSLDATLPPFIEEPGAVEVGVLRPEPGGLWGDPLGWVDVEGYIRIAAAVSTLPSHHWTQAAPHSWGYLDEDYEQTHPGGEIGHFVETVTLGLLAHELKGTG